MNKKYGDEVVDILVQAKRVAKVVKGGRRFSFAVIVVSGDKNGKVGYGIGKASEVIDARNKASQAARKNMVKVPMYKKRTIHHDIYGRIGASKVLLRAAKPGTGIIAGGAMRAVLELAGLHDIVAKSLGSSNPGTMILATFDALSKLSSAKLVSEKRGVVLQLSEHVSNKAQLLSANE